MSKENFTTTFFREYDTRNVTFAHGQEATIISEPTWEQFADSLSMLEEPGTYVLTPELITSAEPTGDYANIEPAVITSRIRETQEISREHPDTTILLGTATVRAGSSGLRNSIVFVQDGEIIGQTHKMQPRTAAMFDFFRQPNDATETLRLGTDIHPVICSDLLYFARQDQSYDNTRLPYQDTIGDASTIFASSCWTPPHVEGQYETAENLVEESIQKICGLLFEQHVRLDTIVMCDRQHDVVSMNAKRPFNFVAQRLRN